MRLLPASPESPLLPSVSLSATGFKPWYGNSSCQSVHGVATATDDGEDGEDGGSVDVDAGVDIVDALDPSGFTDDAGVLSNNADDGGDGGDGNDGVSVISDEE